MAEPTPDDPPPAGDWPRQMLAMQRAAVEAGLAAMARLGVVPVVPGVTDPPATDRMRDFWREGFALWERFLDPNDGVRHDPHSDAGAFSAHPDLDLVRRSHDLFAEHILRAVDAVEGIDDATRERLRFVAQVTIDAVNPAHFALINPDIIERTIATNGENLATGLRRFLTDLGKGQLTHVAPGIFEVGRNLAMTPGKVIHRTPLYELIQYAPTTDAVLRIPLVIFPPWINRFYILDLTPRKSFIRWAVEQGLTVFIVSWKSADADMADVTWDDYIAAQREAIDTVRTLLDVPAVHTIGYCVAGTTLAATLAVMAAEGQADRVASATFFTAQVDFADAGDLKLFITDDVLALLQSLSENGFLDGRYLAMAFNMLRSRDLIWNYVTDHYLLAKDYGAFDLLYWNGDTTNLPGKWHLRYLTDLYRDNRLIQPGALVAGGTPIDLRNVATPAYVQAGRDDHIAPAASVWKITEQFSGPVRFVLAGSGHIAGVVNPPDLRKYQYWTNEDTAPSFKDFVARATETKGSWWPDWTLWLRGFGDTTVAPKGARVAGGGALPAIEDAPGTYVRTR